MCNLPAVVQAIVDLADALDAAAAGKTKDEREQLCLCEGQILQWLRNKLPTNAELGQVTFWAVLACVRHNYCILAVTPPAILAAARLSVVHICQITEHVVIHSFVPKS